MRKRRIILLAVAFVVVLGGWIWWTVATRPPAAPDPVYEGHAVSFWLSNPVLLYPQRLDSNAVPYLVHALNTRDGTLRMFYERHWYPFSYWLHLPVPDFSAEWDARTKCCMYLGRLGKAARPAIPELVRLLREVNYNRINAAEALREIANGEDKPVVEALVAAATKDADAQMRQTAGEALWHLNPEAAAKAGITNPAAGTAPP